MTRQHIKVRYEIGEIVGLGATKRAAHDDAIRQAADFCQSIAPVVVGPFIVWRTPGGYAYGRNEPGAVRALCTMGGSLYEVCSAAAYHACQNAWHPGTALASLLDGVSQLGVRQHLSPTAVLELTSWVRWQQAYSDARAVGLDESAARVHADSGAEKINVDRCNEVANG